MREYSRNVEIMADAAYLILSQPARSHTGRFHIDEDLLRSRGVTNFDKYAYKPGFISKNRSETTDILNFLINSKFAGGPLFKDIFLGDPEEKELRCKL